MTPGYERKLLTSTMTTAPFAKVSLRALKIRCKHTNFKMVLINQRVGLVVPVLQVTSVIHMKLRCPVRLCSCPPLDGGRTSSL